MIFSVRQNTITAYGIIWDSDGMSFVSAFTQLEAQYSQIIVKLHTYGGSVFDGNLIYNALRNSKADCEIHIMGIAASMGAVISLSRHKVYMVENGYMMIHAPSGSTYGTALDHEQNAKLLRAIETNFIKKLIEKTGKTEEYVKKWLIGDNWFDANEALAEGLISGIIEPELQTDPFDPKQLGTKEAYNRFSALLLPQNTDFNSDIDMKKPIIEALGLQGVNDQSSDTAVIEAVKAHFEGQITQVKNELTAEKTSHEETKRKLQEKDENTIKAIVKAAQDAGKITGDQVATYETIGKTSGVEALQVVFNNMQPRIPITSQTQPTGSPDATGREGWDWEKWQKEDPKGLEAMATKQPEEFKKLFNAKFNKN